MSATPATALLLLLVIAVAGVDCYAEDGDPRRAYVEMFSRWEEAVDGRAIDFVELQRDRRTDTVFRAVRSHYQAMRPAARAVAWSLDHLKGLKWSAVLDSEGRISVERLGVQGQLGKPYVYAVSDGQRGLGVHPSPQGGFPYSGALLPDADIMQLKPMFACASLWCAGRYVTAYLREADQVIEKRNDEYRYVRCVRAQKAGDKAWIICLEVTLKFLDGAATPTGLVLARCPEDSLAALRSHPNSLCELEGARILADAETRGSLEAGAPLQGGGATTVRGARSMATPIESHFVILSMEAEKTSEAHMFDVRRLPYELRGTGSSAYILDKATMSVMSYGDSAEERRELPPEDPPRSGSGEPSDGSRLLWPLLLVLAVLVGAIGVLTGRLRLRRRTP